MRCTIAENFCALVGAIKMEKFVLRFCLLGLLSCANNSHQMGAGHEGNGGNHTSGDLSDENWTNPDLNHSLSQREEPFRRFPFDTNLSDSERIDSAGFHHFIHTTNLRFSESDLSPKEAELIYAIIRKSSILESETIGLGAARTSPSGDLLSMDKIKSRAAVKRENGSRNYAIFYKYFDCGWNFSFRKMVVNPIDTVIIRLEEIETWVARKPC